MVLNDNHERYRLLMENLPNAFACHQVLLDDQGNPVDFLFVDVNPAFEKLLNLTKEQIIGKKGSEILPGIERSNADWTAIYSQVALTGQTARFENHCTLLGRTYEATVFAESDECVSVFFQEITERKRAEEKLQESLDKYRLLVENLNEIVYTLNEHANITYVSPNVESIGGYTPGEMIGRPFTDFVHPDDLAGRMEQFYQILTNSGEATEYRVLTKDRRIIWVRTAARPIIRDGRPVGLNGVLIDITEQKTAEKALKASEKRYREILATMEEGYYEVDLAGNFTFCNDSLCEKLGYSKEELLHKNYKWIYKNPEEVFQTYHRVYRTGVPEKAACWPVITRNGTELFAEVSITLRRDEQGRLTGFRGVARDITERKRYEEELLYLSMHDRLTGLYNRAFFEEEMERLAGSREYPITVISADLDELKHINETMGHAGGDELLKACAVVLRRSLRRSDIIARVGGDEFAVLLPGTEAQAGRGIAERIRANADLHNQAHPGLPLSISLGIATAEDKSASLEETYKKADNLMFREKQARRKANHAQKEPL